MGIVDWVIVGAGSLASASCLSRLYAHRLARPLASSASESRAAWYWLGMTLICVLSTLSVLARDLHHDTAAWAALSAACAIAGANFVTWAVNRIRGGRSRRTQNYTESALPSVVIRAPCVTNCRPHVGAGTERRRVEFPTLMIA